MPNLNGWKLISAVGVGVVVAIGGNIAWEGCTEWRSFPRIRASIVYAQTTANAANEKAQRCCDHAATNEGDIKANRQALQSIEGSLERIDANLRHFMLRRGVPPAATPEAPEDGAH